MSNKYKGGRNEKEIFVLEKNTMGLEVDSWSLEIIDRKVNNILKPAIAFSMPPQLS